MNKIALYISRPGMTSRMIQHGYVDALRYLGWIVYICNPKTKLECRKLIENNGVRLIMTSSRYGMRQLPIRIINDNQVTVIVDALPLNSIGATIDGSYEFAHDDEPDIIKAIKSVVVHTHIESHLWLEYMCGWQDNDVDILHLPLAGNLIKALPPTCDILTDVAMVANFRHRQDIMKRLIEPVFKRLDLLGHSYQVFGDNIWQLAGLNYNGPLTDDVVRLAHIYATAKVCPNVHSGKIIQLQAYVNERSFMIPLCGGLQITDNLLTSKYLEEYCSPAISITDYIKKILEAIENHDERLDKIRIGVDHVANNHTYFNRLADLFYAVGLSELARETEIKGKRAATHHVWEMNARLSATERGIPYGQNIIGTT